MMIPQLGQMDGQMMSDAFQELSGILEEAIILKRWISTTPGTKYLGHADTQNYTSIPTTAVIEELTPLELASSGNLYAAGDLHVQCLLQIFGGENVVGGDGSVSVRPSDQIVRAGRTYKIVGHPFQVQLAGQSWWKAVARQV